MFLTDMAIRKAKPADKPIRLVDGDGLYLLLRPDGARWWRLDYRRPMTGKRNTLSLGTYPIIGLAEARDRRYAARKLLATGIDPGQQRKAEKAACLERAASSFAAVADELLTQRAKKLAPGTAVRERRLLEKYLEPYIGSLPVSEVPAPLLLAALRKLEGAEPSRRLIARGHWPARCSAMPSSPGGPNGILPPR